MKQRELGRDRDCELSKLVPRDIFLPELLQTIPPTGDQVLRCPSPWVSLLTPTTTEIINCILAVTNPVMSEPRTDRALGRVEVPGNTDRKVLAGCRKSDRSEPNREREKTIDDLGERALVKMGGKDIGK